MQEDEKWNLAHHRLTTSLECLESGKLLFDNNMFKASANRAYYAVFHAMRAVLALNGLDFSKHSAVIAKFRELYIKTEIFEAALSNTISSVFRTRNNCDYDDYFNINKDAVKEQLDEAEVFVRSIENYLQKN